MVINQYEIFWVNLDPTIGHEIKKIRPCVIISPDEMNNNIDTVIVAPITSKSKNYPTRLKISLEKKDGWIVLDQIRTIDKQRLKDKLGKLEESETLKIKNVLKKMLVD